MGGDETPQVSLSSAIGEVRRQLAIAIEEGGDSDVAFRAGPVELEFTVGFERTAGADAGVRVWVVSVGAKGEVQQTQTNRLTVTLTPVRRGDDQLIRSTATK
jgi:hypothetical protein